MDSKSVHRVAESAQVKARFDSKLKLWEVGPLRFTVDEIAKMHSGSLRERLFAHLKPGVTISQTAREFIAEANDGNSPRKDAIEKKKREKQAEQAVSAAVEAVIGHPPVAVEGAEKSSDVAEASELLKQTGGGVTAALQQHAENVAAGKEPMSTKKQKTKGEGKKRTPPVREVGVVKISRVSALKPKRVEEGKLWLKQLGIDKSSLRNKAKLHGASDEAQKLLKQETQWYTPTDMRKLLPAIFNASDRATIANPEGHTSYAVKCATEARDLAERVLAACK